ncbi:MAG: DUF4411 domain-containing protein [candidate division Zixibacteria bacterium HGW-Zixibacteria-1]|nr:MAG: DUF4411 domain-containing protein [candidate division Zixibacteria bacterium HGW-Zixibacteria-1]
MEITAKYCFDTSAFIEPWNTFYPMEQFPLLWSNIESLMLEQVIVSPLEVYFEINKKDDSLFEWIKNKKSLFLDLNSEIEISVKLIMSRFPKLVDERKNKSVADPFVIALAHVTGTKVVTFEKGGTDSRPKIPNVCRDLAVDCIGFIDFIRNEQWVF